MSNNRMKEAEAYYLCGLEKVRSTPAPEGQKFPDGSFVKIAEDLGQSMSHFESDTFAQVEYTYAHAYCGTDCKSYSLLVRYPDGSWHSIAWYHEHQLTQITDPEQIDKFTKEIQEIDNEK